MKRTFLLFGVFLFSVSIAAVSQVVIIPFDSSPSQSLGEYRLEKRLSEWENSEARGDVASKNGYPDSALYFYTQAANASVGALRLIGKLKQSYCFTLKLSNDDIQSLNCEPDIKSLKCEVKEKDNTTRCAGTKNLCEKLLTTWNAVVGPTKNISFSQHTACFPLGKRITM